MIIPIDGLWRTRKKKCCKKVV